MNEVPLKPEGGEQLMAAIINGPNGRYFIFSCTLLGFGLLSLIGYGIKSDYKPSLRYGNASLTFSKELDTQFK